MTQRLPDFDERYIDPAADESMRFLQTLVENIRAIRSDMNVPPSRDCTVIIRNHKPEYKSIIDENRHFLERLARIVHVEVGKDVMRPKIAASTVVSGEEVFMPLEGLIDLDVERKRLEKEISRIEGLLNGIDAKLKNEKFVTSAPADVVERERAKQENFKQTLEKLIAHFQTLEEA